MTNEIRDSKEEIYSFVKKNCGKLVRVKDNFLDGNWKSQDILGTVLDEDEANKCFYVKIEPTDKARTFLGITKNINYVLFLPKELIVIDNIKNEIEELIKKLEI